MLFIDAEVHSELESYQKGPEIVTGELFTIVFLYSVPFLLDI